MNKRIISTIFAMAVCINSFLTVACTKENKAYQLYQNAIHATTSSGSWTEDITIVANMSISQGNAKTQTKVTIISSADVSNYSASDLSGIKLSGSADMSVMGQNYAWNIQYENGIAHYEYTEPNKTTADIEMDPSCFDFNIVTADMIEKEKVSGNKITFTIYGSKMTEVGIAAVNLIPGIENLNYGDIDVEVLIDKSTGTINKIIMEFHASLIYQGYAAEVDYYIDYVFSNIGGIAPTEPMEDGATEMKIDDGIIIYSDYQNLSVRKNSAITLSAGFFHNL